ncbi:uncharacterized protein At5g39865-like [Wolffia australiana]
MGCKGSKHVVRDGGLCTAAPLTRCETMPVHHPPLWKGDSCHLVFLTFSTLGSLRLDPLKLTNGDDDEDEDFESRRSQEPSLKDEKEKEPEIIDAYEMMSGLENASPLYLPSAKKTQKSLSFHFPEEQKKEHQTTADLDPSMGTVRSRIKAFQERIDAVRASAVLKLPAWGEGKVVFYFTSLRGVRRTFEDCCAVREILRSYGVSIDERDVSMHGGFKDELSAIFRNRHESFKLPAAFANRKFLGGAMEIRRLHEEGALGEALKGCEVGEKEGRRCGRCGGVRFVPCESCYGSCKIYVVEEEEYGRFRRCPDCNENGLVRCLDCWGREEFPPQSSSVQWKT